MIALPAETMTRKAAIALARRALIVEHLLFDGEVACLYPSRAFVVGEGNACLICYRFDLDVVTP